ncbi:MAG: hypothetical protein HZY79_02215 [Rhodoblastus sp.]|nr:MAG: hypothetical protein HZY79_02215 [Rhodoblastus sp.]
MKSSLPRLMNTPGGNALIIDNLATLQQNSMKRADVAMRVQAGELTAQQGILAMRELAKEASGINQTIRDAAIGRTPLPAPRQSAPRNPVASIRVSTPEEARRLPKGTRIILPDGTPGVVP